MEISTDADYVNDLVLLANTFAKAEYLLLYLKKAVKGIGLYVNSDKTEFLCLNQDGAISQMVSL